MAAHAQMTVSSVQTALELFGAGSLPAAGDRGFCGLDGVCQPVHMSRFQDPLGLAIKTRPDCVRASGGFCWHWRLLCVRVCICYMLQIRSTTCSCGIMPWQYSANSTNRPRRRFGTRILAQLHAKLLAVWLLRCACLSAFMRLGGRFAWLSYISSSASRLVAAHPIGESSSSAAILLVSSGHLTARTATTQLGALSVSCFAHTCTRNKDRARSAMLGQFNRRQKLPRNVTGLFILHLQECAHKGVHMQLQAVNRSTGTRAI
jgi:hypothetical protein